MGGMLSQPRPPVPSGVNLIEWCVQQIQITCDALNLDPAQWLNDSTAQGDSPPPGDADTGRYHVELGADFGTSADFRVWDGSIGVAEAKDSEALQARLNRTTQPPNVWRIGDCVVNWRGRKGVLHSVSMVEVRWQDGGKTSVPSSSLERRDYEEADRDISPAVTKSGCSNV